MKHATTRDLFAHWNALRGPRLMPERADIDPARLAPLLPDLFVLTLDAPEGPVFRLAGGRVCALASRELRGTPFLSLFTDTAREPLAERLGEVSDTPAVLTAALTGRSPGRGPVELELVVLPLRHRGRTHVRALGALSALSEPWWIGRTPADPFALDTPRLIPVRDLDRPAPRLRPAGRLMLIEGGPASTGH
jgi:hypothetical protein